MKVSFSGVDDRFVDKFRNRQVNAKSMSSREWAGQLARDRNPFFFSARCSDAKLLSAMKRYIERDLSGTPAHGKARFISDMRRLQGVPRGEDSGKITDIKSRPRLGLIYDFHKQRVKAEQAQADTDNDDHRVAFPYRELFRPASSRPLNPRNWIARASSMGFIIKSGRIFAPRDSILWRRLNRFGYDHAPWDFNSGMDTRYIDRAEAQQLGLPLVAYADAVANPRAVTPEQAEAEKQRKQYYAAKPVPSPEIQQWALKDLEQTPAVPFTREQAATLPLEAYIPPEAFRDRDAQKVYIDRKWEAVAKAGTPTKLTPKQSATIKRYTDNSSEINKALRSGNRKSPEVQTLVSAFDGQHFLMDLDVIRTADLTDLEKNLGVRTNRIDEDLKMLAESNRIKTFAGVTSTSIFSRFLPQGIKTKNKIQVEYRIRIPYGANAMFLDPISTKGPYGLSGSARATKAPPRLWSRDGKNAENEIVIAPGSQFVVQKYERRIESGLHKVVVWLTLLVR